MGTPRIVLDTNVWLDLLVFDDPRVEPLRRMLASRELVAVGNEPCRDEWCRVLGYPGLGLDESRRNRLLATYDGLIASVDTRTAVPLPRCADPDDQKFLELAAAAGAQWLLSRDAAVLALARRTERAGLFRIATPEVWCAQHRAVQ